MEAQHRKNYGERVGGREDTAKFQNQIIIVTTTITTIFVFRLKLCKQ